MKNFNPQKYVDDFKQTQFSVVYGFHKLDDHLDIWSSNSINKGSRYSPTSESKRQIKVLSTFKKDRISLGCMQENKKLNQTENK